MSCSHTGSSSLRVGLLAFVLILPLSLQGETVILKDGRTIKGTITSRNDTSLSITVPENARIGLRASEIKSQTVGTYDIILLNDGSELTGELDIEENGVTWYIVKKPYSKSLPLDQVKEIKEEKSGQGATSASPSTTPAASLPVLDVPTVSLTLKDQKPKIAFEELSRQYGYLVQWEGNSSEERPLTFQCQKLPFLEALGKLCQLGGWGFDEFQTADGLYIKVPETFSKRPVKALDAKGPLMLVWHGVTTDEEHNFDKPGEKIKTTRYRLSVVDDPRIMVQKNIERAIRDEPVTFIYSDGKRETINSDHNKSVFKSGAPGWEFVPRPEWAGKTVDIEVTIPAALPSVKKSGSLNWAKDQTLTSGDFTLSFEKLTSEKKQESNRDVSSPNFMKPYDVMHHHAIIRIRHAGGDVISKAQKEGRQPTEKEMEKLKDFPAGGVAALFEAIIVGTDGKEVTAKIDGSSGTHSPYDGYGFDVEFKTDNPSFTPKQVKVTWLEQYKMFQIPFSLKKITLDPPPTESSSGK